MSKQKSFTLKELAKVTDSIIVGDENCIVDNLSTIENFGQGDPDGENNFTDSNGRGGFRFEPPQGFLSWCTANMKDDDFAPIGPNSAVGTPDKHFDTLLYTGNGWDGTGSPDASDPHQFVGGLNFKPDFIWLKARDQGYPAQIIDTVRGKSAGQGLVHPTHSDPPIGRKGKPIEVAKMIKNLCDENSDFINGQTIHVNGGSFFC